MASVRFNLRPNANKESYIQLIYRIDGDNKKLVIGTGLNVPERFWNKKSMRVRETREFPDGYLYNEILSKWESAVGEAIMIYRLAGRSPSSIELRRDVIRSMKGTAENKDESSFIKYFEDFISIREQTEISKSTIQLYRNALKHLSNFRRQRLNNRKLEFQDLNKEFFLRFITHLKEDMQTNTVHKVVKQLRTVINDAKANGIQVNQDYKLKHTQVSFKRQLKIYLDTSEIERINQLDLTEFSRLDKVRDLFLIGLWTGLRFSDFKRVDQSHLTSLPSGTEVLKIKTQKTNTFVTIPLKSLIMEILKKYAGHPPSISEQKFNQYLKELCKLAGINQKVSRLENGEQVIYEKWQLASSHICRRSFATNSFKAGIHPKLIMPITGHKTVKQFMDYISIDEEESVELISSNPFFQ